MKTIGILMTSTFFLMFLTGGHCNLGDDDDMTTPMGGDDDMTGPMGDDDDMTTPGGDDDMTEPMGDDDDMMPSSFVIRIENISDRSGEPVPFAPGVWAIQQGPSSIFQPGDADAGEGLEPLAEDGDPSVLASTLEADGEVYASGVFNMPEGATVPGPLFPGQTLEFSVQAHPGDGRLTFVTMFGQSNDWFLAPGPDGISLFDEEGMPLKAHDVTDMLYLWNAGTEADEAPYLGPNQGPRQSGPDTGPVEGVVRRFSHPTRAIPLASGLVEVGVAESSPGYMITLSNVSGVWGDLVTPISPVFYALTDGNAHFLTPGEAASEALESLAEDGSPSALADMYDGEEGFGMTGVVDEPDQTPGSAGPAFPGQSFTLVVSPSSAYPYLTFAAMVGQTNDAFLAPINPGIRLFDEEGKPRSAEAIADDAARSLAVWDAGTEANEVPGLGMYQAPRQAGPNMGPDDPTGYVRIYGDSSNDLAGPGAGGFVGLEVVNGEMAGEFRVVLENRSNTTVYPGLVAPVAWWLHDGEYRAFNEGSHASMALEHLAEDGDPTLLSEELESNGALVSGVQNMPAGSESAGPLQVGQRYEFVVQADSGHRFLNLAAMLAPSNDTFIALDGSGLALLDESGNPRDNNALAADVAMLLFAWDAGTEENQAGGAGDAQAPQQEAPGVGQPEGAGTVEMAEEGAWPVPAVRFLVKVTIAPEE